MKRFCICAMVLVCSAATVRADRIDDLEKKLDALIARQADLQQQIEVLKSQPAVTAVASLPTTQPAGASVRVNRAGPWNVTVTASIVPDVVSIQSQLADEQAGLPGLQKKVDVQQERLDGMSAERVHTGTQYSGNGSYTNNSRQKFSPSELGAVAAEVSRAKEELQRSKQRCAKFQRDYDAATTSWTAVGTLEDGTIVEVLGQGNAPRQLVMQMKVAQRYKVEGTSTVPGGKLLINARAVMPL